MINVFLVNVINHSCRLASKTLIIFAFTFLGVCHLHAQVLADPDQISRASDTLKYTSGVRAILEDSQGNIWFGSHHEGVCLYSNGMFRYFSTEDGLSNNQVRSIFEDERGIIWFECGIGLSSFDGIQIRTHDQKNYDQKTEWQCEVGDLWFKSDPGVNFNAAETMPGVYRYDGTEIYYHAFPIEHIRDNYSGYSLSAPFVRAQDGTVWFGTYSSAIGFDGLNFDVIDNQRLGLNEKSGYLHIRSLCVDSKGKLWIGNNGIGVLTYDGQTVTNISYNFGLVAEDSAKSGSKSPPGTLEHVFAIAEDSHGNMWFGDRDTGAWRFDGTAFTNYTIADGLTTTHIWQIVEMKSGELWFAMGDGSVCKYNGEGFEKIF